MHLESIHLYGPLKAALHAQVSILLIVQSLNWRTKSQNEQLKKKFCEVIKIFSSCRFVSSTFFKFMATLNVSQAQINITIYGSFTASKWNAESTHSGIFLLYLF